MASLHLFRASRESDKEMGSIHDNFSLHCDFTASIWLYPWIHTRNGLKTGIAD